MILNKQNYASLLLKEGLCFAFGKSKNTIEYESLEKVAKEQKKGIFGSTKLNIDNLRNNPNYGE